MRDYLLFRLYGPLASWGDTAVGEYRPSLAHPSKSAVLGLLAAAAGVERDEEALHAAMHAAYGLAVRTEAMGEGLRDYHTSQVPPARRGAVHPTRRAELAADDLNTILSTRDYRCDALYTVAIWEAGEEAPFTLDQLRDALRRPRFPLYLGRRSCPPALPLEPQRLPAPTLRQALEGAEFKADELLGGRLDRLTRRGEAQIHWEGLGAEEAGYPVHHTVGRRDRLISRRRWQFGERQEHYFSQGRGGE